MTALDRAKQFIQKNAATTALVIIPLAMASPAAATTIPVFNPGTNCTNPGYPGTPSCMFGTNDPAHSGLFPTGSGVFGVLGTAGVTFGANFDIEVEGDFGTLITFTIAGTGSGKLPDSPIAAAYDFSLSATDSPYPRYGAPSMALVSSSVVFNINGIARGSALGLPGAGGSGFLNLSGWEVGEDLTSWSVVVTSNFTSGRYGDVLHLTIPPHTSLDINPDPVVTTAAAVPEPASLLLVGAGVGLLVVRRRRSKLGRL